MKISLFAICLMLISCTKKKTEVDLIKEQSEKLRTEISESVKNKDKNEFLLLYAEGMVYLNRRPNLSDDEKDRLSKITDPSDELMKATDFFNKNIFQDTDAKMNVTLPTHFYIAANKACFETTLDAFKMKFQSAMLRKPVQLPYKYENQLFSLYDLTSKKPVLTYKILKERKIYNTNTILVKDIDTGGYFYFYDNDEICKTLDKEISLIK